MNLFEDIRGRFERIDSEIRKAGGYLTVSRAFLRVPKFAARWSESELGHALHYTRDGLHMASMTTLAATYQAKRNMVTIPNLIRDLKEIGYQNTIATERCVGRSRVHSDVTRAVETYKRIVSLPSFVSLKKLRDHVIAHHAAHDGDNRSTQGPLNRLMLRTITLNDQLSMAIQGKPTDNKAYFREVLHQGAAFWSQGFDGDPFAIRDSV